MSETNANQDWEFVQQKNSTSKAIIFTCSVKQYGISFPAMNMQEAM
jgi:hypothetical protein